MRTAVALALLAALAVTAPAVAWRPDVRSAARYAEQRAGNVSFDVRTARGTWGHERTLPVRTVSTVKTLLALAYLRRPSVRRRALRSADRALLGPMIRRSDDASASRVYGIVGAGRLMGVARRAGMRTFTTSPVWGMSTTNAQDLARLFWRLRDLAPPRHRAHLLRLHRRVAPAQRWGVARVAPRGWRLHFKSGWGSGSGAQDHQAALLTRGERRVALAITTAGNPSHAYAKQTLAGVARRLLRGLRSAGSRGAR